MIDHIPESHAFGDPQRNAVVMFALFLDGKISRITLHTFLKYFGKQLGLTTQYHIDLEITRLANLKVDKYDCCVNSCVAFTGELAGEDTCPTCRHSRFKAPNKPHAQYSYISLIPRLQACFASPPVAQQLCYRATRTYEPLSYSDIFDGSHFQDLLDQYVVIEGVQQSYKHFNGKDDIPLGLFGDGVRVFKKSQKSIWPYILMNYGFPPEIRTHLTHVIPLFLVLGPHQPKNHNSFLIPFYEEMNQLAQGVKTYHCLKQRNFILRAYLITMMADMQGFKANQYIKGPNTFSPCRTCRLQGCRDPNTTIYYYPLKPPRSAVTLDPDVPPMRWDPWNLPIRTHESYKESLALIRSARTTKEKVRLEKTQGITGESILVNLPGFDRARSVPHDFMHLMYENIIQTLVNSWTGASLFPDTEEDEEYFLQKSIWEEIGKETERATKTIPAYFCRALPNICTNPGLFIAETWAFWFQYLAPYLLQGRLPTQYYTHMLNLTRIIQSCLSFTLTHFEVDALEKRIISWIETYEKFCA